MNLLFVKIIFPISSQPRIRKKLKEMKLDPAYILTKVEKKEEISYELYLKPSQKDQLEKNGIKIEIIKDLKEVKDPRFFISRKNRFLHELEKSGKVLKERENHEQF